MQGRSKTCEVNFEKLKDALWGLSATKANTILDAIHVISSRKPQSPIAKPGSAKS